MQQQEINRFFAQIELKSNDILAQLNAQKIFKLLPEQIRQQVLQEHEQAQRNQRAAELAREQMHIQQREQQRQQLETFKRKQQQQQQQQHKQKQQQHWPDLSEITHALEEFDSMLEEYDIDSAVTAEHNGN